MKGSKMFSTPFRWADVFQWRMKKQITNNVLSAIDDFAEWKNIPNMHTTS